MKYVNIHDAKTHFSRLINAALNGEEVVIARSGKPVIRLCVYNDELQPRRGGQLKGMLQIEDDFDEPLPDNVLDSFYKDME